MPLAKEAGPPEIRRCVERRNCGEQEDQTLHIPNHGQNASAVVPRSAGAPRPLKRPSKERKTCGCLTRSPYDRGNVSEAVLRANVGPSVGPSGPGRAARQPVFGNDRLCRSGGTPTAIHRPRRPDCPPRCWRRHGWLGRQLRVSHHSKTPVSSPTRHPPRRAGSVYTGVEGQGKTVAGGFVSRERSMAVSGSAAKRSDGDCVGSVYRRASYCRHIGDPLPPAVRATPTSWVTAGLPISRETFAITVVTPALTASVAAASWFWENPLIKVARDPRRFMRRRASPAIRAWGSLADNIGMRWS